MLLQLLPDRDYGTCCRCRHIHNIADYYLRPLPRHYFADWLRWYAISGCLPLIHYWWRHFRWVYCHYYATAESHDDDTGWYADASQRHLPTGWGGHWIFIIITPLRLRCRLRWHIDGEGAHRQRHATLRHDIHTDRYQPLPARKMITPLIIIDITLDIDPLFYNKGSWHAAATCHAAATQHATRLRWRRRSRPPLLAATAAAAAHDVAAAVTIYADTLTLRHYALHAADAATPRWCLRHDIIDWYVTTDRCYAILSLRCRCWCCSLILICCHDITSLRHWLVLASCHIADTPLMLPAFATLR